MGGVTTKKIDIERGPRERDKGDVREGGAIKREMEKKNRKRGRERE